MFPAGALRDQARDVTRISAVEEGVQGLVVVTASPETHGGAAATVE